MISRVADHCFWFGRYLERAETTARMLAVTQNLALDAELPRRSSAGCPVIIVAGQKRCTSAPSTARRPRGPTASSCSAT